MNTNAILSRVDHTALAACTTWADVQKLCGEAQEYGTASVCIPPAFVKRVREAFGNRLVICTVVGFPLGYSTSETKLCETHNALADGADEIDMVVNLGDVKDARFDKVETEVRLLKGACGKKVLKVIVETCYLTEPEKIRLCQCITSAGADYIKTSTGFGTDGAALKDIELFKKHIGAGVNIKASGGIRTAGDFEAFYKAGCARIGASSAIKAMAGGE